MTHLWPTFRATHPTSLQCEQFRFTFDVRGAYTIGEFLTSGGATVLTGAVSWEYVIQYVLRFKGTVTVTNGQTVYCDAR